MYYIINITEEENIYKSEIFVFPVINKCAEIISGKLNLDSKICKNLSSEYPDLFEVHKSDKINDIIVDSVKDIIFAHKTKATVGIFKNGIYNEGLTSYINQLKERCKVEPLDKNCKI